MTEQELQQQIEEGVAAQLQADTKDAEDDSLEVATLSEIPLSRCDITFVISVDNAGTLGNAIDMGALSLARYGLNAFYVLATDPDTGREWIINDGRITDLLDMGDLDDETEPNP